MTPLTGSSNPQTGGIPSSYFFFKISLPDLASKERKFEYIAVYLEWRPKQVTLFVSTLVLALPMQDTRPNRFTGSINRFFANLSSRTNAWLQDPWRRSSISLVSLLGGFYLANLLPGSIGSLGTAPKFNIAIATLLVVVVEGVSRIVYSQKGRNTITVDIINALKIGGTYSLFLDALHIVR
jgi:Protein of unknown function (DUF565)